MPCCKFSMLSMISVVRRIYWFFSSSFSWICRVVFRASSRHRRRRQRVSQVTYCLLLLSFNFFLILFFFFWFSFFLGVLWTFLFNRLSCLSLSVHLRLCGCFNGHNVTCFDTIRLFTAAARADLFLKYTRSLDRRFVEAVRRSISFGTKVKSVVTFRVSGLYKQKSQKKHD
jgi:hypothetical protein